MWCGVGMDELISILLKVGDSELEAIEYCVDDVVDVHLFGIDGEVLVRHLGALENSLHKDTHALVLIGDYANEV